MPTKDALASCDDVLLRLQPCIRSILEYLRAQGRHPDTSMIGPHELFRATGCYFTGEEINRLLQAFNSDPMTPEDAAAAGAGQPLGVQASPSVWPLLPSRLRFLFAFIGGLLLLSLLIHPALARLALVLG